LLNVIDSDAESSFDGTDLEERGLIFLSVTVNSTIQRLYWPLRTAMSTLPTAPCAMRTTFSGARTTLLKSFGDSDFTSPVPAP